MKNTFPLLLLLLIAFICTSGIYRDDVSKEKYLKLASQKQFDCVGRIFKDTDAAGSCVLIGRKYVLSAAHVFIESDYRTDTIKMGDKTFTSNTPYNSRTGDIRNYIFKFNGKSYRGKSLSIHPQYLAKETQGSCDIALVTLEEDVTNVDYAACNKSFDELNSNVVGVGFGASGPAGKPAEVNFHDDKIAGENTIDSLSGLEVNGKRTLLLCDFDHPTNAALSKMGNATPRPLEYVGSGGDSGGGLFRYNNKKWELAGIYSQTDINVLDIIKTGYYGAIMKWTRVSAFDDWISTEMKK